jgi:O-antigen/teichoic acid export membrane protein
MLSKGTIFQTSLNLGLRGLAVLSKLLLVIYLGKYFLLSDLGTYHIFAISAALFVFVIGFEFQSFSSREYEKMEKEKIGFFFSNQLFFLALCYLPGLILVAGFFALDFLSWDYIVFFISILFFDLIALHIGVLFAARKFSTWFNFFVFLRGGLWIYIFVGWHYLISPLGLFELFWFWLAGVSSSMFLGLYVLNRKGLWSPRQFAPDWDWIKNGIRIAFPFYILVIFMRLIDYIDRYFLELFHGKTEVGIYSFFAGIANVPVSLISSAITIQFMPLFLGAYRENNREKKIKLSREYLGMIIGILLIVFAGVYLFLEPLLNFVGKDELVQKQGILWILLFASSFLTIGTFPQLILYSKRMDQTLLWTGFVGLLICVGLNYYLVPIYGVLGAAYSALGTRASIFLSRTYFSFFGSAPEKTGS